MSANTGRPPHERFLFMLALPRSGSTLLAYVLDSHSRIHVEHEDSGLPQNSIPDKEVHNLQTKIQGGFEAYLDGLLAPHGKDYLLSTRYFNRRHVQLIAGALGPQVKFIVLNRRHMWRSFKDADGVPHVVPAKQIAEFADGRRLVVRHHAHIEVSYEETVRNPQATFARLCEFIGVEFEPGMLDYAKFDHAHLDNRGNEKARRYGRIVENLSDSKQTGPWLIRGLAERLGLWRAGPPEKDS